MDGIVNVLKPPGMTSSNAVADIRHVFDMKRVGHTGTLDPGAAGVLPICMGRAVRLFDYLVDKQKEYIAEVAFGMATDTQDAYGAVVARSDERVTEDTLTGALPAFTGQLTQIAPMYSAVKVDGRKLYEIARDGKESMEIKRSVTIHSLDYIGETSPNRFLIRLCCSRGTYVRTLCNDIGTYLGVPAYMSFLLRTRSGSFTLDGAHTIAELERMKAEGRLDDALTPMDSALTQLDEVRLGTLSNHAKRMLASGAAIRNDAIETLAEGTPVRVYDDEGFIGVGRKGYDGIHINIYLRGDHTDE